MTGNDIQSKLQQYISGGRLSLPATNDFNTTSLTDWINFFFGGTLTADLGTATVGADRVTYAQSKLDTAGFRLYAAGNTLTTDLVFYADNTSVQARAVISLPASFALKQSFDIVGSQANSPLNQVSFSAASFTLDSGQTARTAVFAGTTSGADGLLKPFSWIFGQSVAVSGNIAISDNGQQKNVPAMLLSSPPVKSPDLSGFELDISVELRSTLATVADENGNKPFLSMANLVADLVTPQLSIPIQISLAGEDRGLYAVILDITKPAPAIGSLQDLSGFTGGSDPGKALLDTPIGSLSLTTAGFTLDVKNRVITDLSIGVELGTHWPIFGSLVLDNLTAIFYIPNPFKPSEFSARLGAALLMGQVEVDTYVTYPTKVISSQLAPGSLIDVGDLLQTFADGISLPGNYDLKINNLSVEADIPNSTYSLACEAVGNLSVIPKFTLTDFSFSIVYSQSKVRELGVAALFTIAKAELYLSLVKQANGWLISGGTSEDQDISMADLVADLLSIFDLQLPGTLPKIMLRTLEMKDYSTADGTFTFTAAVAYIAPDDALLKQITGTCTIASTLDANKQKQWSGEVAGSLLVGDNQFSITYDFKKDQVLSGSWKSVDNKTVGVADIAKLFDLQPPDIPADLDLGLKSASLTYNISQKEFVLTAESTNFGKAVAVIFQNAQQKWQFFFGLSIDKPINLSNLPVIDKVLDHRQTLAVDSLQAIVALQVIDKTQAPNINDIINQFGKGYPQVPAAGMPASVSLSMAMDFGGHVVPLSIGTGGGSNNQSLPATTLIGQPSGNPAAALPVPQQAAADGATWFDVQKSFGPVNFQRVGVKYKDSVLWFLLDASLSTGGLTISVMGLSVGSPIKTFDAKFNIQGLGIDYRNSVVQIGGAFLHLEPPQPPATREFAGGVVIKAEAFSIQAVGVYAELSSGISMFIFAQVTGEFGGPPYFFITGFAGGFGYNSRLRIPTQDEVYQFPLVAGLTDPSAIGGPTPTPLEAMEKLIGGGGKPAWITPEAGEIWIAAGIQFTTFNLINSTALLTVEFGNSFSLALIGLSKARFPMEGPEVYAYVELQLLVVFDPGEGVLSFSAVLSPNSFLLDKNCHLTGGFAFFSWFGNNPHAGDFVLTLGGYSPYFSPPPWYPQEPRLGFNWAIDKYVTLQGGVYFALTPSALMAGGRLDLRYHNGNLQAWFTAWTDIIIWWNPFHFIAGVGISIGVSYKLDLLFTTKTIKVELGADLTLWGPPTGGIAHIHWWIISFTVSFGKPLTQGQDTQTWAQFSQMLPKAEDAIKITAVSGLTTPPRSQATQPVDQAHRALPLAGAPLLAAADPPSDNWLARPNNFSFNTVSAVPAAEIYLGQKSTTPYQTGDKLNIRPMAQTALVSQKRIYVLRANGSEVDLQDPQRAWTFQRNAANVPKAMWGAGSNQALSPGDQQLVDNQLVGLQLTAPNPILGASPGDINIEQDLSYDPLSPGENPLQPGLAPSGPTADASDQTISLITRIMSTAVLQQRDATYTALTKLGVAPDGNDKLNELAKKAGELFADEPLLLAD